MYRGSILYIYLDGERLPKFLPLAHLLEYDSKSDALHSRHLPSDINCSRVYQQRWHSYSPLNIFQANTIFTLLQITTKNVKEIVNDNVRTS